MKIVYTYFLNVARKSYTQVIHKLYTTYNTVYNINCGRVAPVTALSHKPKQFFL